MDCKEYLIKSGINEELENSAAVSFFYELWHAALANQWIPVSDLLPDDDIAEKLMVTDGVNIEQGWFDPFQIFMCPFNVIQGEVTHWMPMPPLPGGGE